jgi:hypothetical protein
MFERADSLLCSFARFLLSRFRRYNNSSTASGTGEVTEEELEAYRREKSHREDDPMAKLASGEEILPL